MAHELIFVALFLVATAVALVARALRMPYTVALVVTGLTLGATRVLSPPHLTQELLYAVFLPGLVFEAAFHLDFKKFWANKLAIHALAVPGLIVAISLTALILVPVANSLHFVEGFTFAHGLVFAALLAATDPIAVVGLFKSLGAPRRLMVLVEGESLLNDGTAVVVFSLVLAFAGGRSLSAAEVGLTFVRTVGGGLLVGAAIGYATSKATQRIEDAMIEITLTTIAAYGSFAVAERLHLSGVIATVAAGMLCGNYGARTGMSPSTRLAVESFWEYVAFALNSVVFLLIGFEVRLGALLHAWKPVLVAFVAVTAARAVVVSLVGLALRGTRERFPASWVAVLTWGGLRGGLSMVLALALPRELAHRELIVTMTFGVVVLSILGQGLTMAPLLRRLGLVAAGTDRVRYEVVRGEQRATTAALAALEQAARGGGLSEQLLADLRGEYQQRLATSDEHLREMHLAHEALRREERHALARQLLLVEKDAAMLAHREGAIGAEAVEEILRDVDARLVALEDDSDAH
ncbi:MAG: sodium:proton antiporter [Deltaproteobacteria bacterium]|nr:sodium:proton antiporter [Myxococcales bacterium]MDP3219798.1 sodium:proton antiporter [Deltaproteobacteria bacterium]